MDRIRPMSACRYNVFRMLVKSLLAYDFLILREIQSPIAKKGTVAIKRYSEAPRTLLEFAREASRYVDGRELARKL